MKNDNSKNPAFPFTYNEKEPIGVESGLSKREYIATQMLSGLNANRWSMEYGNYTPESLAKMAVESADALLKELEK